MSIRIPFNDFVADSKLYKQDYFDAFTRVLDSGWFILGSEVKSFEQEFSDYLNVKHVIGVANGLEALQISLMALGVSSGDEVITTPLSAVATTLSILAVGATPVFVDIDASGQLDVSQIQAAINGKTKIILPVDLYGSCPDYDAVNTLASSRGLVVLEDACQAHGSTYKEQKLGTLGTLGCFSFYPTKNIGALGDGGAIATSDEILASACRKIRDYGQSSKYQHELYGLNSRLDELQAAFLRLKLARLDAENKVRTKLARYYQQQLSSLPDVTIVTPAAGNLSNYHLFVIRTKNRDQLQQYLTTRGITTAIHFPTLIPEQPFLKHLSTRSLPNASKFVSEILSLPLHPHLSLTAIDYICNSIREFFSTTIDS